MDDPVASQFPGGERLDQRIQRAEVEYLFSSKAAQTALAENYVGSILLMPIRASKRIEERGVSHQTETLPTNASRSAKGNFSPDATLGGTRRAQGTRRRAGTGDSSPHCWQHSTGAGQAR